MIRLIALDVDGTLVGTSYDPIEDEILNEIERLMDRGILFCFATGRQFSNLKAIARHLADRFYYLPENGAVIFGSGPDHPLLFRRPMDRETALNVSDTILSLDGAEVVLCGSDMFYLLPKDPSFPARMDQYAGCKKTIISSYDEIHEPIVKVSAFSADSSALRVTLMERCDPSLEYAVSGKVWMDIGNSDKGTGIRALCRELGIQTEEVAAFGDNWNDLQILDTVGHPYIRDTAPIELRKRYSGSFHSVNDVLTKF